jgi:hypothetical protein
MGSKIPPSGHGTKKPGRSLKEKRAAKKAKRNEKTKTGLV